MGCILWYKSLNNKGYGQTTHNGKVSYAHRVAYCKHNGLPLEAIKGKVVLHPCDTPACVNPEHLSLGTMADNSRDMVVKGRSHKPNHTGELHPNNILTEEDVLHIRSVFKKYCKVNGGVTLAKKYGVATSTIYDVINRVNWTHI